ncbi:hypothetical protein IE982_15195 [Enterobacter hormaechei]|uniref:Uncharacterized protein n=1 Tax=Enterobacter hormaechei TaxID=158836 RepID=A0A927DMA9_9ENTR|nr:hypothetical protein [Enterobacter hormaechei]MBD3707061.1 hypothetical protein [Enterobacter hormaechei]
MTISMIKKPITKSSSSMVLSHEFPNDAAIVTRIMPKISCCSEKQNAPQCVAGRGVFDHLLAKFNVYPQPDAARVPVPQYPHRLYARSR